MIRSFPLHTLPERTSVRRTVAFFVLLGGLLLAGERTVLSQSAYGTRSTAKGGDEPLDARVGLDLKDVGVGQTVHIVVGHSMVLRGVTHMKRIYVGNPAVLQTLTSGPSEVVLTAKSAGISSLVIWSMTGQMSLYTVAADVDPEALRQTLQEAYPAAQIGVDGHEGRIYLSGSVPTQEVADGAVKMSAPYAKDVVSSLRIVPIHPKQVQLKLRIIEVDRTRMEQYGVNLYTGGSTPGSLTTGQFSSTLTTSQQSSSSTSGSSSAQTAMVSDPLNLFLYSFNHNVGATIKDFEQKQILQVLAEPTLTAISGQAAKFLSGGEFPYPVVQSSGTGGSPTISISFRPYGVKVDFTPTVNADGSIRLKVAPEVSTLDFSNAVTISGFTIPALSTRRAETEVEIKSGQSFAVSGLLDHRTIEILSQLPGITKVPILGKLFTSKSYTHSVVELVVLVTASVVDPLTDPSQANLPKSIVPNLDYKEFDHQLSREQKIDTTKVQQQNVQQQQSIEQR